MPRRRRRPRSEEELSPFLSCLRICTNPCISSSAKSYPQSRSLASTSCIDGKDDASPFNSKVPVHLFLPFPLAAPPGLPVPSGNHSFSPAPAPPLLVLSTLGLTLSPLASRSCRRASSSCAAVISSADTSSPARMRAMMCAGTATRATFVSARIGGEVRRGYERRAGVEENVRVESQHQWPAPTSLVRHVTQQVRSALLKASPTPCSCIALLTKPRRPSAQPGLGVVLARVSSSRIAAPAIDLLVEVVACAC